MGPPASAIKWRPCPAIAWCGPGCAAMRPARSRATAAMTSSAWRRTCSRSAIIFRRASLSSSSATTAAPSLHGTNDGCVGVELCDGVERAYSAGVRVCRLRGAGHFAHLEQPDAFTRELLDFLAEGAFSSLRPQKVHGP